MESERLANVLTEIYIGQIKRANFEQEETMSNLYQLAINEIDKTLEKNPANLEGCLELYSIVDAIYNLVSDKSVRDAIVKGDIKPKKFMELYKEEIFGGNKRKYDMSNLFDEQLIKSSTGGNPMSMSKKIKYTVSISEAHEYVDIKGDKISIEEIGKLYMEQWNGVLSYISRYKVSRLDAKGKQSINEVYANINISKMEEREYREAVLQELLSRRNIMLSNSKGYIGEIVSTDGESRKEVLEQAEYLYRINDKYSLKFDGTDLSAVMLYEKEKELINNSKQKREDTDSIER